ncbi:MAG: hypothetical protein R2744_10910 [Bacteroidales bacterium]
MHAILWSWNDDAEAIWEGLIRRSGSRSTITREYYWIGRVDYKRLKVLEDSEFRKSSTLLYARFREHMERANAKG